MENEQQTELYNKGFKAGEEHTQSSPQTIKQFNYMEKEITNLKIFMEGFKKDLEYLKEGVNDLGDDFCNFKNEIRIAILDKVGKEEFNYWRNWGIKISVAISIALIGLIVELFILIIK